MRLRRSLHESAMSCKAFTLAEMMVVMLILSIVMAAFAPVMTTRQKRDNTAPWRYSDNGNDAYYGLKGSMRAMIGQKNRPDDGTDPDNKLTIVTSSDTQSHILFKKDDTILGKLFIKDGVTILGDGSAKAAKVIAIGTGALVNNNSIGIRNVAIGYNALNSNTMGMQNTAVGYSTLTKAVTGGMNTAIGASVMSENTTGIHNSGVGANALYKNTSGNYNTAIGSYSMYTNTTGKANVA